MRAGVPNHPQSLRLPTLLCVSSEEPPLGTRPPYRASQTPGGCPIIEITGTASDVRHTPAAQILIERVGVAEHKATPTSSLYRCITSSQDQEITWVQCREGPPNLSVRSELYHSGNPVYGDDRTQVFSTQV